MSRRTRGNVTAVNTEEIEEKVASIASSNIDMTELSTESKKLYLCITQYFENLMKEKDTKIKMLEDTINSMRDRIDVMESELDDNAAYIRRETLVISGKVPHETRDEDCKSVVVNMIKQDLKLNISINDLSVAHRVGHRRQQGPSQRNIMLKLCRRDIKYDILSACKQQRPAFYVNESLTPTRSKILFILRQAKKKYPTKIKSIRSYDGSITVYLPPVGRAAAEALPLSQLRKRIINTRKQLERLLEEELQTTIEALEVQWEGRSVSAQSTS